MISKRNVIILAISIILLIGATIAVFVWDGPAVNDDFSDDVDIIKIFECDDKAITNIVVTMPGESTEYVRKDDDNWSVSGYDDVSFKNFSIGMLASDISSLTAKSVVADKTDNLASFGLAQPKYSITARLSDGSLKTFYAGDKTAIGDAYYFKDKDSDTIYTIYELLFDSLFTSVNDYRNKATFFVDKEQVAAVRVERQDYTLNLRLMDEPISIGGYNIATWEMTEPRYETIDISRITEYVIDVLPTVTINSVVSDKKDYANYGLNKPYAVVTITNLDGSVQRIKLGNSNNSEYYVVVDGDPTVYSANKSAFGYVDIDPFLLINKFVNIISIDDISTITVTSDKTDYNIAVDGEGDNQKYTLNGKQIDGDKFKSDIYQQIIGLIVDGYCNDAVYGRPDVSIEYTLRDGSTSKAEFVNYDDRNYAVYNDGECRFIILKKSVNAMLESIKKFQ